MKSQIRWHRTYEQWTYVCGRCGLTFYSGWWDRALWYMDEHQLRGQGMGFRMVKETLGRRRYGFVGH